MASRGIGWPRWPSRSTSTRTRFLKLLDDPALKQINDSTDTGKNLGVDSADAHRQRPVDARALPSWDQLSTVIEQAAAARGLDGRLARTLTRPDRPHRRGTPSTAPTPRTARPPGRRRARGFGPSGTRLPAPAGAIGVQKEAS
ncbi:MAG: hypothetical protein U0869_02030 [Chloroflexota bacterium]